MSRLDEVNRHALPPHSIDAEHSILGGLLIAGESAWDEIAGIVEETDFYLDSHRRIFSHIRHLIEISSPVDIITVSDAIEKSNELDQTGGLAYLAEIAGSTPSTSNIVGYAKVVKERSRARQMISVVGDASVIANNLAIGSTQERVNLIVEKFSGLIDDDSQNNPKGMLELLQGVVDKIEDRAKRSGEISGLPTGFAEVDRLLDGLKGGDLIVIAGRPSMGKTAFAINIAQNVALSQKPAMIFSMEMSDQQLVTRILSSVAKVSNKNMSSANMNDEEWTRVADAIGKLHTAPLIIDETSNPSLSVIRARARRQQRRNGLSLIVIDYLQLMSAKGNTRNEELGTITRGLKLLAKDLDVPIILLSQLSRKVEERADKHPIMSDLRESGSIEQDADVVIMLYRDEYYNRDSEMKGFADIGVKKNRNGECGEVQLLFQGEYTSFSDAPLGFRNSGFRQPNPQPQKPSRFNQGDV